MSPIEMLAHLRETVGQMLSILDSRSTAASPEFDILRQYNQRLLDFDVSSASPATIEALEIVFYSLLQQYPLLNKVEIAVSYAMFVDACQKRADYLADIQLERNYCRQKLKKNGQLKKR